MFKSIFPKQSGMLSVKNGETLGIGNMLLISVFLKKIQLMDFYKYVSRWVILTDFQINFNM